MGLNDQFDRFIGDTSIFLVQKDHPMGTAFIFTVRDDPSGRSRAMYLVTARHNLEEADHSLPLVVRHNLKTAEYLEQSNSVDQFIHHPTTDIAVAPVRLRHSRISEIAIQALDDEVTISREEIRNRQISEGSHVCVVSLFPMHTGKNKMQSIQRFGRIAMIPNEPITLKLGYTTQPCEAILIETMVWPGSSGFVNQSGGTGQGKDRIPLRLLGLISSHFETFSRNSEKRKPDSATDKSNEQGENLEPQIDKIHLNTGISTVIPAYIIKDFVHQIYSEEMNK